MEAVFEYIKPIVFFLILESVVFSLISDGAFKKLAKMFCGVVLIILILAPVGKLAGLTETPGDFLKNAQLEQSMRQCEEMIHSGDEYLADKYSEQYEKIIRENIGEMVEKEGMRMAGCEISMDTEGEVKITKIALHITEGGEADRQNNIADIQTDITISIKDNDRQVSEEPEVIKIRNQIMENYHIEEENIFITKS